MVSSFELCILVLGMAASVENVTVIQSPASLNVTEGETALLHCSLEGLLGAGEYMWYRDSKNGSELSNNTPEYRGRVIGPIREESDGKMSFSIQLTNVTLSDAATYYCKVGFLIAGEHYGPGTTLIVAAKKSNEGQQPANVTNPYIALLITAILFVLVLFSAIITVISRRHKRKVRHDGRPATRNANQTNEVDNVQYSILAIREQKRTLQTPTDKEKAYEVETVQYCSLKINEVK